MVVRTGIVGGSAVAVLASLMVGVFPSTGSVLAAPAPRSVGAVESVAPLPVERASGPAWPDLPRGVAEMPQGSVASGRSPRVYIPAFQDIDSIPGRAYDISSGQGTGRIVATFPVRAGWGQIAETLPEGRDYAVQVQAPSGTWQTVGTFSVTGRSAGVGPSLNVGGIAVSSVTGEVSWSWNSPRLPGPVGSVGVGLGWGSGIAASSGMPPGWRLSVDSGSAWATLREGGPDVATLLVPGAPTVAKVQGTPQVEISLAYPRASSDLAEGFVLQKRRTGGEWKTLRREAFSIDANDVSTQVDIAGADIFFRVGVRSDSGILWSPPARVAVQPRLVDNDPEPIPGAGDGSQITAGAEPAVVTLTGWGGSMLTFVRNDFGVYEQAAGSRAPGFANTLSRDDRGRWQFIDTRGTVTTFVDGHARTVQSRGATVAEIAWDDQGRPTRVTNEVGRTLTLMYAGSGDCPSAGWTAYGYAAPPAGMLCRIAYPDGSATDLGYVSGTAGGAQIALVREAGNQATGLGWDSLGRLVSERSSLVLRTATIDPGVAGLSSQVDYDGQGRAAILRSQPAAPGAQGTTQRLDFPTVNDMALTRWVESPQPANAVQAKASLSGGAYALGQTWTLDPVTWQTLSSQDATGLKASVQSGADGGQIGWSRTPQGLVTRYEHNEIGLVTKTVGPVAGASGRRAAEEASVITRKYDTTTESGRDVPLSGLRAQVYSGANYAGEVTDEFWASDPRGGGLSASWKGRSAALSLQATGVWTPDPQADKRGSQDGWRFTVSASTNADVSLIVGGQVCVPSATGCVISNLPEGPKQVTVQVARAAGEGFFTVRAAAGGDEPALLPFDAVAPGFANATVAESNDTLPGSADGARTTYAFSDPASGRADAVTAPGNLRSLYSYEEQDPSAGEWGRLESRTTPGGEVQTTSYWPNAGTARLPAVCGAATVQVSGQPKTVIGSDGLTHTRYFDVSGRLRALHREGNGVGETICMSYYDDGTQKSSETYDDAGRLVESSLVEQSVDGDPRMNRVTLTHGPAAPVDPGTSVTSTSTRDLLGREVAATDFAGTTTVTQYDALGNVTSTTVTPPAGSGSPALTRAYTYDPQTARPLTMRANGVLAATSTYDASTGRLSTITYADSVRTTYGYAANGIANLISVSTPDARFTRVVHEQDATAFGRITSSSITVKGTQGLAHSERYGYDAAGRLAQAAIVSTPTGGDRTRTTYDYSFAAQSASCGTAYPDAGKDGLRTAGARNGVGYVTCHDAGGRTVSTTDPLVAGGGAATLEHDALGRVTRITGPRPAVFTWGAGTALARVSESGDGGLVQTTLSTYSGSVLDKTVATESGSQAVRYAGPFVLALEDGQVAGTDAIMYDAPGGALVTTAPGSGATLTIVGLDGAALVTVDMPSLGSGAAPIPGAAIGVAPRYGPFGEPLIAPTLEQASAIPDLGWQAGAGQETLPGISSITLMGARPYHPALGEFLAPDPNVDAGNNRYSYTDGDPINSGDRTGNETDYSWLTWVGAVAGAFASNGFALVARRVGGGWGAVAAIASVVSVVGSGVAGYLGAQSAGANETVSAMTAVSFALFSALSSFATYSLSTPRSSRMGSSRQASVELQGAPAVPERLAGNRAGASLEPEGQIPAGWGEYGRISDYNLSRRRTAEFGGGGGPVIQSVKRAPQPRKKAVVLEMSAQEIDLDNYVFGSRGKMFTDVKNSFAKQTSSIWSS